MPRHRWPLLCCLLLLPHLASGATKQWKGGNGNWSDPAKWEDGAPPAAGDDLVFVNLSQFGEFFNVVNDLPPGMAFHSIFVQRGNCTASGNAIALGDGGVPGPGGGLTFNMPVTLTASQTWSGVQAKAPVDLGANTLTIQSAGFMAPIGGTGGIVVTETGGASSIAANTYSGPTIVNGLFGCGCVIPGAVTTRGHFVFDGPSSNAPATRIGSLTSAGGTIRFDANDATATSGNLTFDSASAFWVNRDAPLTALTVNGTVTLGNAALRFTPSGNQPVGTVFTLIDNDDADPVAGTFAGLPEGARVTSTLKISYRGGTGNDVTVTVVPPPVATTTTLVPSPNPSVAGRPVTITANVFASGQTAEGTVTFFDGSVRLGAATLSLGSAHITAALAPGEHALTAAYQPSSSDFLASTSPVVAATALQFSTTTTLTGSSAQLRAGDALQLTATVRTSSEIPSGTVAFFDSSLPIGHGTLAGGVASISVDTLPVGQHSLTAVYSPDVAGFTASTSTPIVVMIVPRPTTTALSATPNPSARLQPVALTATVTTDRGAPAGMVTFFDGDVELASVPLTGGSATLQFTTLAIGKHTLRAVFLPATADYAPSTSDPVTQTVADTTIRHRAAGH